MAFLLYINIVFYFKLGQSGCTGAAQSLTQLEFKVESWKPGGTKTNMFSSFLFSMLL